MSALLVSGHARQFGAISVYFGKVLQTVHSCDDVTAGRRQIGAGTSRPVSTESLLVTGRFLITACRYMARVRYCRDELIRPSTCLPRIADSLGHDRPPGLALQPHLANS